MPRKQFVADFETAKAHIGTDYISGLTRGDEDGDITFIFDHPVSSQPVAVTALVDDVGSYPRSHDYTIFLADDAPQAMCNSLGSDLTCTKGKTITELLKIISTVLVKSLRDRDGDSVIPDSQDDEELPAEASEDGDESDVDLDLPDEYLDRPLFESQQASSSQNSAPAWRQCLVDDLKAAKTAGFKVGHLGALKDGLQGYISVSCQVKKLGISTEAMEAWNVEADDYLILLMQYHFGYKTLDSIVECDSSLSRECLQMRVGLSKSYKPTLQEAILTFTKSAIDRSEKSDRSTGQGFHETFISKPLHNLLNDRLVALLKLRKIGLPWSGAESYYNDHQGAMDRKSPIKDKYYEQEASLEAYAKIVQADHMSEEGFQTGRPGENAMPQRSLPLAAMQFLLRHFVRCTEFCLVCHRHLTDDLQAIKPYVCDSPLCLYQYMTLGFGPTIEHEILSQPQVVDLLVSFCYLSASGGKLNQFPTGLGIMVPSLVAFQDEGPTNNAQTTAYATEAKVDIIRKELLLSDCTATPRLKAGDWIVVRTKQSLLPYHARVSDVSCHPSVRLDQLSVHGYSTTNKEVSQPDVLPDPLDDSPRWEDAVIYTNNVEFDGLTEQNKQQTIIKVLDSLPNVNDLHQFLVSQREPDLKTWSARVSPPALAFLRWIIASNRACILQVNESASAVDKDDARSSASRVHGMPSFVQFRFAMGAPNKEQRFISSVRITTERLKLQYPTFFAWHGSPLVNWHSIIREGLNYKETANGRAYGHGCYHSLHCSTSLQYTQCYRTISPTNWSGSRLIIESAMALNEIVNAPGEFVSRSPHLVVDQLDWIQTRYLFVKCGERPVVNAQERVPRQQYLQDPNMTPLGETGVKVSIPANFGTSGSRFGLARLDKVESTTGLNKMCHGNVWAVVTQQDPVSLSEDGPSKIRKTTFSQAAGTQEDPVSLSEDSLEDEDEFDDACSIVTLEEDRELLQMDNHVHEDTVIKSHAVLVPKSEFVPGALDHSSLPRMATPQYANSMATKRLQADFRSLLKVQNTTPSEELGWYIDPEKFDNVYQWIVELHSFEAFRDDGRDIPLVDDMKKRGIKSIVLEMRFSGSYPMSPPFVRIIQPRFLAFAHGGGGHVTAGGALCMQLLTNSGWSAVSTIESVLLQVRMAIASTNPKPARLESERQYGIGEAIDAYKRACQMHGWQVPADFASLAGA